MNDVDSAKVERSALVLGTLGDESDEDAYWFAKTPDERLRAIELMRQIIYGYDPSTTRLQRVLAVAQYP